MKNKKKRQQELQENLNTLHELEKNLDTLVTGYNHCMFLREDLIKILLQTDDDTMDYDELKKQIKKIDKEIYHYQEGIRTATIALEQMREKVYQH